MHTAQQAPKPSSSLDVEAVDATAADEIVGLVQGFLLQVLGGVAVLRHHKDVILQSKGGEQALISDKHCPK